MEIEGQGCLSFRQDKGITVVKVGHSLAPLREFDFEQAWTELHMVPVSYTHLRAHETSLHLVCRFLLEKNFFFNDTATTEIYTLHIVGSVRCV